ncbi:probable serine/threonine-protein kinase PBL21 isoform X1 [Quercus robur]|uniref:probable serine/threonine-protein kinase PBL21 isoform X1 n=1 Tax=Quercus robur TaxID=38942 RepID=UPI0021628FB6|nr:probable serine/threonine-protein kinase PBL21 isoform X1 [Quercus robur]XP_050263152.1 probable serine/threonine-protein kinase PBL21 isoform X1 [Quercus robur]
MMIGRRLGIGIRLPSLLRSKKVKKKTIIVGLKADNCSRVILLQLLNSVAKPGDNVLAIHVQVPDDTIDPNTFQIHEDICKSKQVDFQVKVSIGDSYLSELTHQVRVNYATILALGCSPSGPNDLVITNFLKRLPPTCSLLVLDGIGKILIHMKGTSQQGSSRAVLQTSLSSPLHHTCFDQYRHLRKSLTAPSCSTSSSAQQINETGLYKVKNTAQVPEFITKKLFQRLELLEEEGSCRHYTPEELHCVTNNFNPDMVIGEGGHSNVYQANLEDGRTAAVKILKLTHWSADDLLREVDLLSGIKHEHIVQMIGYCNHEDMRAIMYNLHNGSLKQNLRQLKWSERMRVAVGVAKALEYLHHSCNPPIIHRDAKSSNILLSDNCQPQLSDFGEAIVLQQSQLVTERSFNAVGTFGYLAPEYMMYGTVDEKTDVYSFGVMLLELITGKEAIQTNQENHESLVLWAGSLLNCGIREHLIDPYLHEDFDKEEIEIMMSAASLCLLHSSFRRPTMKAIVKLFEEPEHWLKMQKERDESRHEISSTSESSQWGQDDSSTNEAMD